MNKDSEREISGKERKCELPPFKTVVDKIEIVNKYLLE